MQFPTREFHFLAYNYSSIHSNFNAKNMPDLDQT